MCLQKENIFNSMCRLFSLSFSHLVFLLFFNYGGILILQGSEINPRFTFILRLWVVCEVSEVYASRICHTGSRHINIFCGVKKNYFQSVVVRAHRYYYLDVLFVCHFLMIYQKAGSLRLDVQTTEKKKKEKEKMSRCPVCIHDY